MSRRLPGRKRMAPVVAALLIVTAGCGIPTDGTPKPIARSNIPYHLLFPTNSSSPSSTVPIDIGVSETIYLVAPDQHLVAVQRYVEVPADLTKTVGALMAGPTASESAAGLQSFLTGNRVDVTVSVAKGIATVHFAANPTKVVGPDQTLAIAQVVFTVTQQRAVTGLVFQIGGRPIAVPTSSGAQVSGPVDRADYQPQAPLP